MSAWTAPLIQAGGSLLGGLLGRKKAPTASMNVRSHVKGVRQASEEHGFNPLTLLAALGGPVPGNQPTNYMGAGVADAAAAVADGIRDNSAAKAAYEKLRAENDELKKNLQSAKLRPVVAGPAQTGPIPGTATPVEYIPTIAELEHGAHMAQSMDPVTRPRARPGAHDGAIPVFGPSGTPMSLNARNASRLGVNAWDMLHMEDYEATYGEIGGELAGMGSAVAETLNPKIFMPLRLEEPKESRERRRPRTNRAGTSR